MNKAGQPKTPAQLAREACTQARNPTTEQKACKTDDDCVIVNRRCNCESINKKYAEVFLKGIAEKCTQPFGCLAMVDRLCNSKPSCQQGACGPRSSFER